MENKKNTPTFVLPDEPIVASTRPPTEAFNLQQMMQQAAQCQAQGKLQEADISDKSKVKGAIALTGALNLMKGKV